MSFIETMVNIEIDKMLENQLCTICKNPFLEQKEKDEAVCSGTHPLTYAHGECWTKENEQMAYQFELFRKVYLMNNRDWQYEYEIFLEIFEEKREEYSKRVKEDKE